MCLKYVTYSNTIQNKKGGEGMQIIFCWFVSLFCLTWRPDDNHKGEKESRVRGLGKGMGWENSCFFIARELLYWSNYNVKP